MAGCSYSKTKLTPPKGPTAEHTVWQFGTRREFKDVEYHVDGTKVILRGYKSDAVEGFQAGLDAAKTLKP